MPDAVQRLYWQVLAQPERRIELIDNLSDEDFDQRALVYLRDGLTPLTSRRDN